MKFAIRVGVLALYILLTSNAIAQDPPIKCVKVYTTAKDTDLRLTLSDQLQLLPAQQSPETDIAIFVNPEKQFQTLLGIGGAITDASSEVYAGLDDNAQKELISAYFEKENGIGYSLMRTTIHSCDFASSSYTYVDDGDSSLESFDISPDKKYRIPMIKDAINAAGGSITTFASPWSAPAFMKNTNNMLQGGKLLPQYRRAWANYFTKFIDAYQEEGIPIFGVTVQNEPLARQTWESMIYTAEEERDFVRDFLGPAMERAGLGDKKIVVWDHNRDLITHRANTILSDPEAAKYVWGVGFHWYETWAGGDPMFENVAEVKHAFPDVQVLLTEACVEGFNPSKYHHWPNAERYGEAIVNDLNSGAVGWLDWNILLNDKGGPNHVGNLCFAPVHADSATGKLIYTPSYFYLGHYSKFIRPNARRVSTVSSRSSLRSTSFLNSNNKLITVVLNLNEEPIAYRYSVKDEEAIATIPARAIQTLVYDLNASPGWEVDFFDDFDKFDPANWQDQMIWVNDEKQCYVPDNQFGTREVSNGTLKLKVVNIGEKRSCENRDKHGKLHPPTEYMAGRICSKNRKEFVKGKWTARLRLWGNGKPSMFPAWWILGNQNNEPPVQEPDENVPWPLTGSGEIDIFEHHGDSGADHFTTGAIKNLGNDKGDWWSLRKSVPATLDDFHEYSVEWARSDLIYRVDGVEVHRNIGEGDKYPEKMFAILNFAKLTDTPMEGEWVMEVDWVKHESWNKNIPFPDAQPPANVRLNEKDSLVSISWDSVDDPNIRYNVYRSTRPGEKGTRVAYQLLQNRFTEEGPVGQETWYYAISASSSCFESRRSDVVHTEPPFVMVPARIEAENFAAMQGIETEKCGDEGDGLNLGYFHPEDFVEYNIEVSSTDEFVIDYRLASQNGSQGFEVLIGDRVIDKQSVQATGGWQSYTTKTSKKFSLEPGKYKLRLRAVGNEWNINWLEIRNEK